MSKKSIVPELGKLELAMLNMLSIYIELGADTHHLEDTVQKLEQLGLLHDYADNPKVTQFGKDVLEHYQQKEESQHVVDGMRRVLDSVKQLQETVNRSPFAVLEVLTRAIDQIERLIEDELDD